MSVYQMAVEMQFTAWHAAQRGQGGAQLWLEAATVLIHKLEGVRHSASMEANVMGAK